MPSDLSSREPKTEVAPVASMEGWTSTITRDDKGRFLSGNNGGGRRKGARNKLTETFLEVVAKDFSKHGAQALSRLREDDPATYLKIIAILVPRELISKYENAPDIAYEELSDEEFNSLLRVEMRRARVQFLLDQMRRAGASF